MTPRSSNFTVAVIFFLQRANRIYLIIMTYYLCLVNPGNVYSNSSRFFTSSLPSPLPLFFLFPKKNIICQLLPFKTRSFLPFFQIN